METDYEKIIQLFYSRNDDNIRLAALLAKQQGLLEKCYKEACRRFNTLKVEQFQLLDVRRRCDKLLCRTDLTKSQYYQYHSLFVAMQNMDLEHYTKHRTYHRKVKKIIWITMKGGSEDLMYSVFKYYK